MIIVSLSGGTVINTKEIVAFNFLMKRNKKGKVYKKNGHYIIDKTKIDILFKNGIAVELCHVNEKEGETMFNFLLEKMKEDNGE